MSKKKKKSKLAYVLKQMADEYQMDAVSGAPVHWVVYAAAYGNPPRGWHIHHIDYDKFNNHAENLIAIPSAVHSALHREYPTPSHTREELEQMAEASVEEQKALWARICELEGVLEAAKARFTKKIGGTPRPYKHWGKGIRSRLNRLQPKTPRPPKAPQEPVYGPEEQPKALPLSRPSRRKNVRYVSPEAQARLSPVSDNPHNDVATILSKKGS